MKLDEKSLKILRCFGDEYVNPHDVYREYFNGNGISRATFYRRLEYLKQLDLIEWRVGKVKLTAKGKNVLYALNGLDVETKPEPKNHEKSYLTDAKNETDRLGKKEDVMGQKIGSDTPTSEKASDNSSNSFKIYESEELKKKIDDVFVYVDYPTASYILKALLVVAGVDEKGLKTNVEKFRALKEADFRVKLAVNHFENSSKQVLVFLDELMKLGKISTLYCGVKNERKALKNKKLVEFWQDWNFENERFKLPKESVTVFPLFLVGVIGITLVVALRSGYEHASILSVLIVLYFFRSMLFKEIREY
jgi:hypothetical protein